MACQIVIVGDMQVKSLSGIKKWFYTQERHCYTRKIRLMKPCISCKKKNSTRLLWYYEVVIDGETYQLHESSVVLYDQPIMLNPIKWGDKSEENTIHKDIYEDSEKDEDYPANGDYQGYMKKKLGLVQSNKPDFDGDTWLQNTQTKIIRQGGTKDGDTTV